MSKALLDVKAGSLLSTVTPGEPSHGVSSLLSCEQACHVRPLLAVGGDVPGLSNHIFLFLSLRLESGSI